MLAPGGEKSLEVPSTADTSPNLRIHAPHDPLLSPSIRQHEENAVPAFEVKFLLENDLAHEIQQWAMRHMLTDSYADPKLGGAYQTTTLYLDTIGHDVYHRSPGYRGRKFRLRRYGQAERVFLERKTRSGDRVEKRRSDIPLAELGAITAPPADETWAGSWFRARVNSRALRPACRMTYDRTAFVELTSDGPLRLTLDRNIRGLSTDAWDLTPLDAGCSILPDHVVCEFKFRGSLPGLFKELIYRLQLEAGSVSKYRRMMAAAGLSGAEG